MTSTTTATTLSPEQGRTLFDHLLPSIVQSRAATRELIRNVPDSKLDFLPIEGGETLSDLMWYLASAYDAFLNAVCDAKFPELPAKPQPVSVQAFLEWDDSRFEQTVERAKALSNEDLLRPLSFGPFTQPTVEFMTVFLGNVASHTGQLMAWLAMAAKNTDAGSENHADGELSEEELAGVAGGLEVPTTYVTNDPYQQQQMTQVVQQYYTSDGPAGLGALLGSSAAGYGFVGATGALAVLQAIFGIGVGSNMAAYVGVGVTAGRATLMALGILRI
jgi:uncharacterized damage-inducible protein DinB